MCLRFQTLPNTLRADIHTIFVCVGMRVFVLRGVAVCCSVVQCGAACCSVLQRVAVCCSVYLSGGELALVARVKTRIGNVHVYVDVCVGVYVHAHAYAFVYVYVYLYVKVYCIRTCIYLCMRVHS